MQCGVRCGPGWGGTAGSSGLEPPSQESLAVPKAGMSPWLGSLAQREAVGKLSFSLKEAAGA